MLRSEAIDDAISWHIWIHVEPIPDHAWVVRGGRNRPEDIQRGIAIHPSGVTGVSVECGTEVSVQELARPLPHRQIGLTTVSKIRKMGGEVIRTSGRSRYHATVVGITPEQLSLLFTPSIPNLGRSQS